MASNEGHIHSSGADGETINYLGQDLILQLNGEQGDPIGTLRIKEQAFVGSGVALPNSTNSSPVWSAVPGTSPVLEVRADGHYPIGYIRIRQQ